MLYEQTGRNRKWKIQDGDLQTSFTDIQYVNKIAMKFEWLYDYQCTSRHGAMFQASFRNGCIDLHV